MAQRDYSTEPGKMVEVFSGGRELIAEDVRMAIRTLPVERQKSGKKEASMIDKESTCFFSDFAE